MQNKQIFIQKQAHDWLIKLETGAMAEGDEERFVEWLGSDPLHGEAFSKAEQTWGLMHETKSIDIEIQSTKTPPRERTHWARHYFAPMAATVVISIFTVFWGQDAYFALSSDYYTNTGVQEDITLADKSVVTLNTDSAININFDGSDRVIELITGEINVQVAPNDLRPFVVIAGDMDITALGTEFMVRKQSNERVSVVVTEHTVSVEAQSSGVAPLLLNEGQTVSFNNQTSKLSAISTVNRTQATAWLDGKYVFIDESLITVVNELNRYYNGRMIIRDKELNNIKVSGVLDINDPISSLNSLAQTLPVNVTTLTPFVTFINKG